MLLLWIFVVATCMSVYSDNIIVADFSFNITAAISTIEIIERQIEQIQLRQKARQIPRRPKIIIVPAFGGVGISCVEVQLLRIALRNSICDGFDPILSISPSFFFAKSFKTASSKHGSDRAAQQHRQQRRPIPSHRQVIRRRIVVT